MTIQDIQRRIGDLSASALHFGGELLLDRVTAALGVASRHAERIRNGQLDLVPAVEREIEDSFDRAAQLITDIARPQASA